MNKGTIITPAPAYQKPSGKLYLSADQLNLVNNTWTLVELDAIGAGFADGIENTGTHRITLVVPGFYTLLGQVTFKNAVVDCSYDARLYLNGSTLLLLNYNFSGRDGLYSVPVSCPYKFNATDYVELWARSISGGDTVDIAGGVAFTFLSVQRVR